MKSTNYTFLASKAYSCSNWILVHDFNIDKISSLINYLSDALESLSKYTLEHSLIHNFAKFSELFIAPLLAMQSPLITLSGSRKLN